MATINTSTGSSRRATARGWAVNSPKLDAVNAQPARGDRIGGRLLGDDDHRRAGPLEQPRDQSAHAAGAKHSDLHRRQSMRPLAL